MYAARLWIRSNLNWTTKKNCIFASSKGSSRGFSQKCLRGFDLYDRTGQRNRTQFIASASSQYRVFNASLPLWCDSLVKLKLLRWEASASPLPVTWDGHQHHRLHACKFRPSVAPVNELWCSNALHIIHILFVCVRVCAILKATRIRM